MRITATFISIVLTSYGASAVAAEPADFANGRMSLGEVVIAAWSTNPELRVLESSIVASRGGVTTARAFANPELTVTPGIKRTREEGVGSSEFHGEVELSQLFKFPGKRFLQIALAQRNVELQELALEAFRFQLAAKVRGAFYEMLAAERVVALRREQAKSAKAFVEAARKRAEGGYASDFETLKSQADLIAASRAEQQARSEITAARVTLNMLMGRDASAPLEIAGRLDDTAPTSSQKEFIALAMARNPSLRTLSLQAEMAGLTLRSTRFGRRPDFAIGPSVEYTENEQIYGVSATVALPLWDQKKGEIQSAAAEREKALAELEKARAEIAGEVTRSVAALREATNVVALYTPEFLDKLKGLVDQAEQSYAQSATTLIIYLDARRTYFDTLSDYYEALAKVAAGRAQLESAVGVSLDVPRQ